jgi:hypothetical protein
MHHHTHPFSKSRTNQEINFVQSFTNINLGSTHACAMAKLIPSLAN